MERHDAMGGLSMWKVHNPTASNSIQQMKSGGFQTPFYFGGSQVPNALGVKGNSVTSINSIPNRTVYSMRDKVVTKKKRK